MYLDAKIATLASRQLTLITRDQLTALGASRHQIERRLRDGLLVRKQPAVFSVSASPSTFDQRVLAACLALGDDAFASHATAAHLWELVEDPPPRLEITVPFDRRPRLRGIAVHRSQLTDPSQRTRRRGIPVARPMRALLDLAASAPREVVAIATDRALYRGLVEASRLAAYVEDPRFATRKGSGALRSVVQDRVKNGFGESTLESVMFELVDRFGLPRPVRQFRTRINGRNVRFDLCYPEAFIAIEVDGEGPHRIRWQSDHDRHNITELSRWRVVRFTWEDVRERPVYVAVTIADALGIKPSRWIADRRKRPS